MGICWRYAGGGGGVDGVEDSSVVVALLSAQFDCLHYRCQRAGMARRSGPRPGFIGHFP